MTDVARTSETHVCGTCGEPTQLNRPHQCRDAPLTSNPVSMEDRIADTNALVAQQAAQIERLQREVEDYKLPAEQFYSLQLEYIRLRAALERAIGTLEWVSVFVKSRERVKRPEGEELFDKEVQSYREALKGTAVETSAPPPVETACDVCLADRRRLQAAIVWALGYTDFRSAKPGEKGAFYWRTELRERSGFQESWANEAPDKPSCQHEWEPSPYRATDVKCAKCGEEQPDKTDEL